MGRINGTRRWFGVGGFGIQPSELAKLAAIFFTAALLERRMHRIDEVRYSLLPIVLVVGGITALVLIEPDYGTALSIAAVAALMVFAAGLNFKYLLYSVMALVPLSVGLLLMEPYRVKRLWSFLCPECDPTGAGFQLLQSLIAVGTGGIGGAGLMAGKQKLFYLPEPQTDFILAVIGEELGLIGTTVTLVAFILITWRGLQIARRRAGSLRVVSRARPDGHVRGAGVHQHEHGARDDADQGHPAAVRELRRVVAAHQPRRHGHPAERVAACLRGS